MTLCAAVLAAALTRAEIIDRLKAPPLTRAGGLVQVVANCPADMRREYQGAVGRFADDICQSLYRAEATAARDRVKPRRFTEPEIVITLGDGRTNDVRVLVRVGKRESGAPLTRIRLPSPGFSDLDRLRTEVVRAFYRSVKGVEIDDAGADRAIRNADPDLKDDWEYEQIERWLRGERVEGDDEEMLRLCRAVIAPGVARESDVLRFQSRLRLYPESFDRPFCGRYPNCTFADAIALRREDPRIRIVALVKSQEVVLAGGGRSEELTAAADAYSKFLMELARDAMPDAGLRDLLDDADTKLEVALEEARRLETERKGRK